MAKANFGLFFRASEGQATWEAGSYPTSEKCCLPECEPTERVHAGCPHEEKLGGFDPSIIKLALFYVNLCDLGQRKDLSPRRRASSEAGAWVVQLAHLMLAALAKHFYKQTAGRGFWTSLARLGKDLSDSTTQRWRCTEDACSLLAPKSSPNCLQAAPRWPNQETTPKPWRLQQRAT